MTRPDCSTTRPDFSTNTLLIRLQQQGGDAATWEQFVSRYGPRFYSWCRAHGLQDADAQDVTQEVFSRVFQRIRTFDQARGAARTWLFTILRHCLPRSLPDSASKLGGEAALAVLESQEAVADLEQRLAEEFDQELVEVAEQNVRSRLRGDATWPSYELTCKQELSEDEAAKQLGIPRTHVIRYRNRVIERLQKELRDLEDQEKGRQAP
jgi:RNA polymerase sigma-70 factor (ECF subfamily)